MQLTMIEVMNPRAMMALSRSDGSDEGKMDLVVNYWENARPLIKELEQTVHFAERKYGDLMQQLNLCKEYYEKLSSVERCGNHAQKRKTSRRFCRRRRRTTTTTTTHGGSGGGGGGGGNEKAASPRVGFGFNAKLKNKIFEITNEIKEANRRIFMNEACFGGKEKSGNTPRSGNEEKGNDEEKESSEVARSEAANAEAGEGRNGASRPAIGAPTKKRSPALTRRSTAGQKYKLRSKSLPQGVRRKFGFGSFVEVVDKQRPKFGDALAKIKSRTTVSSGSRTNVEKPRSRAKERKKRAPDKSEGGNADSKACAGDCVAAPQTAAPCCGSAGKTISTASLSVGNESKSAKTDNSLAGRQRSLAIAPRQPIPFTICRTTKTFNLGLNIQQVLSLIKSKRHSAMLQAILKDNMRTTHSVLHKNEPNINALYIATSSRLARGDSDVCPARDDGDRCYSVISGDSGVKCRMLLTCGPSARTQIIENPPIESVTDPPTAAADPAPALAHIKFSEIQRPEDVWAVEQPDSGSVARFRSRCTCYPSRNSVDYHKVLKQYSRLKEYDRGKAFPGDAFCSSDFPPPRFVVSGPELRSLPSRGGFAAYDDKFVGTKIELKKIREDLDNLRRRYERVQELLEERGADAFELDAELDALESELSSREEDCKYILGLYNGLMALKKRIGELRGRIRSTTNLTEVSSRPPRSRKDPFRPTPSMTLTRVLRQIQCLQDKIKLIDSPVVT